MKNSTTVDIVVSLQTYISASGKHISLQQQILLSVYRPILWIGDSYTTLQQQILLSVYRPPRSIGAEDYLYNSRYSCQFIDILISISGLYLYNSRYYCQYIDPSAGSPRHHASTVVDIIAGIQTFYGFQPGRSSLQQQIFIHVSLLTIAIDEALLDLYNSRYSCQFIDRVHYLCENGALHQQIFISVY